MKKNSYQKSKSLDWATIAGNITFTDFTDLLLTL